MLGFALELDPEGSGEPMKDSAFSWVYHLGGWRGAGQRAVYAV